MQMVNRLTAIFTAVDDNSIAVGESGLFRDAFSGQQEMSHEGVIGRFGIRELGDRFFGDHQNMHRSLGINIFEGQTEIIFIDNISRNFAADDFAENGFGCFAHANFWG